MIFRLSRVWCSEEEKGIWWAYYSGSAESMGIDVWRQLEAYGETREGARRKCLEKIQYHRARGDFSGKKGPLFW